MSTLANDFPDLTFAFALNAPSDGQILNMHAMVSFIKREFAFPIVVIERGEKQNFFSKEDIHYQFEKNIDSEIFTASLLNIAKTKFVAITKENFLFDKSAFMKAYQHLRSSEDVVAVPYDGRIVQVNYPTTNYFRSTLDYATFVELIENKKLNYFCTYSFASIYIADKEKFLTVFKSYTNYLDLDHSYEFIVTKLQLSGNHIYYGSVPLHLLFQNDHKVDIKYDPTFVNILLNEYQNSSSS